MCASAANSFQTWVRIGGGGGVEEVQYYGDCPFVSRAHSSDGGDAHIDGIRIDGRVLTSTNDRCIGWKTMHAIYLYYAIKNPPHRPPATRNLQP